MSFTHGSKQGAGDGPGDHCGGGHGGNGGHGGGGYGGNGGDGGYISTVTVSDW